MSDPLKLTEAQEKELHQYVCCNTCLTRRNTIFECADCHFTSCLHCFAREPKDEPDEYCDYPRPEPCPESLTKKHGMLQIVKIPYGLRPFMQLVRERVPWHPDKDVFSETFIDAETLIRKNCRTNSAKHERCSPEKIYRWINEWVTAKPTIPDAALHHKIHIAETDDKQRGGWCCNTTIATCDNCHRDASYAYATTDAETKEDLLVCAVCMARDLAVLDKDDAESMKKQAYRVRKLGSVPKRQKHLGIANCHARNTRAFALFKAITHPGYNPHLTFFDECQECQVAVFCEVFLAGRISRDLDAQHIENDRSLWLITTADDKEWLDKANGPRQPEVDFPAPPEPAAVDDEEDDEFAEEIRPERAQATKHSIRKRPVVASDAKDAKSDDSWDGEFEDQEEKAKSSHKKKKRRQK